MNARHRSLGTSLFLLGVLGLAVGCATPIDPSSTGPYPLSATDLKVVTEQVIDAEGSGWYLKTEGDARTTHASYTEEGGHRTDVVIRYREAGEGESKLAVEGESGGDMNVFSAGIIGLQGKQTSMKMVDLLIKEIEAAIQRRVGGGGAASGGEAAPEP